MIPMSDAIKNISKEYIRNEALKFANPLLEQSNEIVADAFENICDTNDHREKRFIITLPVIVIVAAVTGSVFALSSFMTSIQNQQDIRILSEEVKRIQQNMEKLTAAINNVDEMISNDRYLTKTKQEFEFHVSKIERALLKFMQILGSRKTVKLSELPEPLLKYFEKVGYTKNKFAEKLYLLRLKSCHRRSIVVEVIADETSGVDAIKCNKYSSMGFFDKNLFHQHVLPSIYCYNRKSGCSELDTNQCIPHLAAHNCTHTAFSPCTCEIKSINQCKIKSQHALNNFIQFETYDELTTVATTYKLYKIQYPTKSVTKNVPSSGVFTLVINEEDFIKIGEYTIRGKSLKPTYIENIIDDTFVVGKMEERKNLTIDFTSIKSEFNEKFTSFEILTGILVVVVLIALFFVGCCVYKKCTKKSYNKLAFVVPQISSS
uniref:Envelope protein n=1 Tax=Panagrolaimus sp. ES5 TaxID=591445 RepID=A0AC34FUG9_9BILA